MLAQVVLALSLRCVLVITCLSLIDLEVLKTELSVASSNCESSGITSQEKALLSLPVHIAWAF